MKKVMGKVLLFFILILFFFVAAPAIDAAKIGILYGAPGKSYSPACQAFVSAFNKEILKHAREKGIAFSSDYTFLLLEIKNQKEWFIGLFMDFPFQQPEHPGKPLEPFWRAEITSLATKKVIRQKAREAVKELLSRVREQERLKWTI